MPVPTVRTLLTATTAASVVLAGGISASAVSAKGKGKSPAAKSVAKVVSTCTGTKLESEPLKNGAGKKRGHVELWYSTADGGTNCVQTYDDAGGKREMSATLVVQDRPTSSDTATYEYYAGGAAVTQTAGQCVQWGGYVWFGKTHYGYTNDRWTHCK
ncbi:MAG: hypothetical protein Q7T55_24650 [Solirubrobacteraceae bacterium]|nr:hypothetical protein [Solirubrobacteraceae bacterium]